MANRTRAAPMASVYESHPDGGFGPGYSGEYVTAPTPPNHTTAKYGSFMQRSAMHHNPPPSYTGVHNPPAPASTYAPSIFSAPLAKDATPRDQGKSGASTKSEAERSGGWCAGWYWERPGWKLDKGVLNMDKWAPDTYGRTRGFLILLASVLAVVCAILLIILLGRKHDGRPSGGVNTPRYKVNEGNVIDNWVVFQGDWFMQNTFLSVAAEILDERATLHGLVRGNWSEEAPRALPPYRDYLLVCYQDDACLLQGFACTHFQAPCEVGKEGTTVNEDRCQPHGTNVVRVASPPHAGYPSAPLPRPEPTS